MKRSIKLLILVLSLALIFGTLAIVSSAAEKAPSVALTASAIESDSDGIITLQSDMHINETIDLKRDLTLNLNGYTLTANAETAFNVPSVSGTNNKPTLTINGEGRLTVAGKLFESSVAANTPTLNVAGGDNGIYLNHTSNHLVTIVTMVNGNASFSNLTVVSNAAYNSGPTVAMFDSEASTGNSGVIWNFDTVSVFCETAARLASDFSVAESSNPSNSLITVGGTKSTATIRNCYFKFVGHMFNAVNLRGRASLSSTAPANYDLAVPSNGASGPDGQNMYYTHVMKAYNTVFDTEGDYSYRNHFINASTSSVTAGSFYFNGCTINTDYALSVTCWNSGALANDPLAIVLDNGSTVRLTRMDNSAGDKGTLVMNADLHLLGGSAIICAENGVSNNGDYLVSRAGNIYATVGARFATKPTTSRIVFFDTDGTMLSTVEYARWASNSNDTTHYYIKSTSNGVSFVFDPVGNPHAPWIAIKAGTNYTESNLWTQAYSSALEFFDNYHFIHTGADKYNAGVLDAGVAIFVQDSLNPNGALKTGSDGAAFDLTANTATGSHNGKSSTLTINTFFNSYWWNMTGNVGVLTSEGNSYFRWYIPANPYDKDATTVALRKYTDANNAVKTDAPANLGLSPNNLTVNVGAADNKVKIAVYDVSFATETTLMDFNVKLHVRDSADKSFTALTIKNGVVGVANYTNLVNGTTLEDRTIKPAGEWNHLCVVVYVDPTVNHQNNSSAGAGVQYWFLNGKHIATTASIATNPTANSINLLGFRFDYANYNYYTVGQSLLVDNMATRFYTEPLFAGETIGKTDGSVKANHMPEKYLLNLTDETKVTRAEASVGGVAYESFEEALEEADGRTITLLADVGERLINTDSFAKVNTNGYSFVPKAGSTSFFSDYGLTGYAPDGQPDVDGEGNPIITIDPSATITVKYYVGNPHVQQQLNDPTKYVTYTYNVGEYPVNVPIDTTTYITKEGQKIYKVQSTAWNSFMVIDASMPISDADYHTFRASGKNLIEFMPNSVNKTLITSSEGFIVVVGKNGEYVKTLSGSLWGSGIEKWNIEYGQTLIFNKSVTINGAFSYKGIDPTLPREERVISIDLNGFSVYFDPTAGDTDAQTVFPIYVGDTFNFYSSVPGGSFSARGIGHYTTANGHEHGISSEYLFEVRNPAGTGIPGQITGSYSSDNGAFNKYLQYNPDPEIDTFINIGTATDYAGVTHSGSNLTFFGDGLIKSASGSKNSVINIKGLDIYKNSFEKPIIMLNGFSGNVNIDGVDIRDSRESANDVPLLIDTNDAFYINAFNRALANVRVTNSTCFSVTDGANLFGGECGYANLLIEDFVSNCLIAGDEYSLKAITVGNGVAAEMILDTTDSRFVELADGCKRLAYGETYNAGNAQKLTFTVTTACNGSTLKCNFSTSNVSIGNVNMPYIITSEYATVTVIGLDGSSYSYVYANGTVASEEDFVSVLGNKVLNVVKITPAGTYNNGTVTFPFTVNGDVTLTVDGKVGSNLSGFYSNVSLSSYFKLNVYVPAEYASYIEKVTLDGVEKDLGTATTTTLNGSPYYVLQVWRNPSEVSSDMKLVLNLSDEGYTRTTSFTLSILDYSETILAGDYTNEEKALMKYIIAYAKATNDYISKTDALIDNAYVSSGANALTGFDKSYVAITSENQKALATAFSNVTVTLKNSAPAFIFTVKSGYNGTVNIGGKNYTVTGGQEIVIDNIKAYNFLADLPVKIGDVTATFNFGNYAAYSYGKSDKLDNIIDAIYDYCTAASTFTSLPKCTVTLDANGGSAPASRSVVYGMPMPAVNATRKGYTFLGWYNGNTPWDSTAAITENITLTAMWQANTYTVSFDENGRGSALNSITVTYGENVTLPKPTYGNYTVIGWYYGNEKIEDGEWNLSSDAKLIAKWGMEAEREIIVTIAGNSIEEYYFETDMEALKDLYIPNVYNFTDLLYAKTGNSFSDDKNANYKFIVRYVEDAGSTGYRAYVDSDKNFIVECAYANVFDTKFEEMAKDIFFKTEMVNVSSTFERKYVANVVYYKDFGAVGDGVTDDYQAIYNTHIFANQGGQKVMGEANARYYIHVFNKTIPVMTDVDFNGATFYLDDTGSEVYKSRGTHLFTLTSTARTTILSESQINTLFPGVEIEAGATSLPWLADYIDVVSFVTIKNNHKDYIRWGANTSSGYVRQDILIVNPDGTLNEDTPVIWNFKAEEQYIHNWAGTKFKADSDGNPTWLGAKIIKYNAISSIKIVEANDEPITVENGFFERKVCRTVAETGYENVYHAYGRGLQIKRCNSTVKNLTHYKLDEPEFHEIANTAGSSGSATWKAYYGVNTSMGNGGLITDSKGTRYYIDQSYPYGGMISFNETYNSRAVDCNLTGRTVYYEAKTTSGTPIAMGSYDLHIYGSSHVYIENVQQLNDINDTQYWGIMNSNRAKNLFFIDSSLSRFDAHEGFWNGTFTNTTFGRYINVIGGGYLKITGCTRNVGSQFISMRGDYGSTFNGTIELVDCTMRGLKEYRRTMNSKPYIESGSIYIINTGYSGNYKNTDNYTAGNAGSFPFLKWDFGYTCYMPQYLIIDNFKVAGDPSIVGTGNQTKTGATLYVYPNTDDAAFVKPSDFVQAKDYEGQTVTLADGTTRPMTADDVYYNQYQLTKAIYFKNMSKVPTCPTSTRYMYKNIPVYVNGVLQ